MPVHQGVTNRTLMSLTLETSKSMAARERRDIEMGLQEVMQQFQLEFAGTASTLWGFAELGLDFDSPFYYAPGQRDPDFDRPHFWFGAQVSTPVAVTAVVTEWTLDSDNGGVIGAALAIGVCASEPDTVYEGTVHLTFQGFAALTEGGQDIDG